jgi:3-hydroxyacyl-CoA dehydrogenase
MWLHGFGFPRYRGGLMFWADTIGVQAVYHQIAEWHSATARAGNLLREIAEKGGALREAKSEALR